MTQTEITGREMLDELIQVKVQNAMLVEALRFALSVWRAPAGPESDRDVAFEARNKMRAAIKATTQ